MPEGKEYPIVLGAGQAIPGIEELIMEAAPGETVERPVKWPDDFPTRPSAAKTKTVRVTLNEVKRKSLPDARRRLRARSRRLRFARRAADGGPRRTWTTARQARSRRRGTPAAARRDHRRQPLRRPAELGAADRPGYAEAYQVPEEERERFAGEFRPMAERQVRRDLVIETIAETEKLAATEKDIDDRSPSMARSAERIPGSSTRSCRRAGGLKEMERSITEDKVFKWLLEQKRRIDIMP